MSSRAKHSERSKRKKTYIPVFFSEHARLKKYKSDQMKILKGGN